MKVKILSATTVVLALLVLVLGLALGQATQPQEDVKVGTAPSEDSQPTTWDYTQFDYHDNAWWIDR